MLLATVLLLPAVQLLVGPAASTLPTAGPFFRLTTVTVANSSSPALKYMAWIAPILIFGALLRTVWLITGLSRLYKLRSQSRLLQTAPLRGSTVEVRSSTEIQSAVSFGLLRPVILVPESWPGFAPDLQRAVIAHELSHLQRRDWPLHLLEEVILTAFWFHPAIRFVIGQIRLAREEAVDAETVRHTQDRHAYIRALLASVPGGSGIPAPAFRTAHNLTQRIKTLKQEYSMSKRKAALSFAGIAFCLLAGGRAAVWSFPLQAAQAGNPEKVYRVGNGVTAPAVVYKRHPSYTQEAKEGGLQGVVNLSAEILPDGTTRNIQVVTSLDPGLDAEAIAALREWHFRPATKDGNPVTVSTTIEFHFRLEP